MNQIKLVFGYTFRDAVRKKAFLISTVIILLLVFVLASLTRIFPSDEEQSPTTVVDYSGYTCYYIDEHKLIKNATDALLESMPGVTIVLGTQEALADYRTMLTEDKTLTVIEVTEQDSLPFVTVIASDFMSRMSSYTIVDILSKKYSANTLSELGFDETAVAIAQLELPNAYEMAGNMNISGYAVGILLTMLIFFAIYYYGYGVAMSVAAEKTSRVMETLVVSAKPSRILIGKCLAMGAVGLLQFTAVLSFASICFKFIVPEGFSLMGMPVTFSAFTLQSALLILLYFLLGYSLYAVLNSVCGASVNKIEDLNAAILPVTLISIMSFYFGYVSAATGTEGTITKIAMYLPFSSPFIIPFKLLNGNVSAVDLSISITLMITFIIVLTYVSIKIYSASVLHYGKKQKLWVLYKTKL